MALFKPTEADTRANFIDPALKQKGWEGPQLVWREYYYTDGMKLIGKKIGMLQDKMLNQLKELKRIKSSLLDQAFKGEL